MRKKDKGDKAAVYRDDFTSAGTEYGLMGATVRVKNKEADHDEPDL